MQRLGFHKITWAKLISAGMCVIALAAYLTISPGLTKVQAGLCGDDCLKDGQATSFGGCSGGQRCGCNGGYSGWNDDDTCPKCTGDAHCIEE